MKGCGKIIHNLLCWDENGSDFQCGQYYDSLKKTIYCKECIKEKGDEQ